MNAIYEIHSAEERQVLAVFAQHGIQLTYEPYVPVTSH
jgi:hypothetical protein